MTRLRTLYFIVANTALLILLAELAAHLGVSAWDVATPAFTYAKMAQPIRENYAHMPPADVDELWRNTLASRWRYEPIVGFVAEQQQSRFVNVNAGGIRSNGGLAHSIDGAIWFLGGSTTFGYGVADSETIPAFLEQELGRPVVNFGVPGHYSLYENRLMIHYLRLGFRPSAVLFLDGVNESCQADLAEDELGGLVALSQRGYSWQPSRPVVYAAMRGMTKAARALNLIGPDPALVVELECHAAGRVIPLSQVAVRALDEREFFCKTYGLDCRTYIQPFAGVHGRHDVPADQSDYLPTLYRYLEPGWKASQVTFVTGALDGQNHHAYVDEAHYSMASHKLIASAIAATLPRVATTTGAFDHQP